MFLKDEGILDTIWQMCLRVCWTSSGKCVWGFAECHTANAFLETQLFPDCECPVSLKMINTCRVQHTVHQCTCEKFIMHQCLETGLGMRLQCPQLTPEQRHMHCMMCNPISHSSEWTADSHKVSLPRARLTLYTKELFPEWWQSSLVQEPPSCLAHRQ